MGPNLELAALALTRAPFVLHQLDWLLAEADTSGTFQPKMR